MKPINLLTLALTLGTALAIWLWPQPSQGNVLPPPPIEQPQAQQIEVVFVLDTTGSMGALIQTAKEKIWSIASTLADARGQNSHDSTGQGIPQIKLGLVTLGNGG